MKKILYCLILLFGIFATVHAEDYSINYDIKLKEGSGSFEPINGFISLKKNVTYELQIRCNIQRPWNVRAGVMWLPIWAYLYCDKNFDLSLSNFERFTSEKNYYDYDAIKSAEEYYKAVLEDDSFYSEAELFYKTVRFMTHVRKSGNNTTESFYIQFTPKSTGRFIIFLALPNRFISEDEEFRLELPVR